MGTIRTRGRLNSRFCRWPSAAAQQPHLSKTATSKHPPPSDVNNFGPVSPSPWSSQMVEKKRIHSQTKWLTETHTGRVMSRPHFFGSSDATLRTVSSSLVFGDERCIICRSSAARLARTTSMRERFSADVVCPRFGQERQTLSFMRAKMILSDVSKVVKCEASSGKVR